MAIKRIYFENANFVLTLIYDSLTDMELVEHVHAMNTEYEGITGIKELADCRYLYDVSQLTARDMLSTADAEKGSDRVVQGKGAIIAESDVIFGLASMYAAIASNIREESKAYRKLDEGLNALDLGDARNEVEELLSRESYQKRFEELGKSLPE